MANIDLVELCVTSINSSQLTVYGRIILANGTTQGRVEQVPFLMENLSKLGSRIG